MNLFTYDYLSQSISFELKEGNVMVNATEMAKLFNKRVENFTRIENTKAFVKACIKNANQRFISVESINDLIVSSQKSGTWMHRVLALKFAAWLDPEFELWVFCTIDDVLYKHHQQLESSLKSSALRKLQIEQLHNDLQTNDKYIQLKKLEQEEKKSAYKRGKMNKGQLDLFVESFSSRKN